MQVRGKEASAVKKGGPIHLILGQCLRQLICLQVEKKSNPPYLNRCKPQKPRNATGGRSAQFATGRDRGSLWEGGRSLGWPAQGQGSSEDPLRAALKLPPALT